MQDPSKDAPKAIRDWLIRYAGKNPFGKPNWRVCLAQNVTRMSGGIFTEMPDGENVMFDVDARGKVIYKPITPDRITSGVFEIPRYPHEGWIMERWMPAHCCGPRQVWESHRSEDGSSLLGPYPHEGLYLMICGPFEKMPPMGDMSEAIAHYECTYRNRPADLEGAVKQRIRDEESKRLAKKERLIKKLEEYRKSEILPMLKRVSLSAQAVRNQLQKDCGLTSHFGVQ